MKKLLLPLLLLVLISMLAAVESDPSAVVGYVKYDCIAGLNHMALPMEQGFEWASEFADSYPGAMDAMNYWDAATQAWMSAIDLGYWEGDFEVQPGSVLMVYALDAFSAYSIGELPAQNATYSLVAGLNDIMVPLNRADIMTAGQIGDEIMVLDALNYWDAATQSWMSAINLGYWEGDFDVTIGFPIQVYSLDAAVWPGRASVTNIRSRN